MIIMNVIKILMITRDLRCLALVWKNCGTTLAGHHPFLAVGQGAILDHDDVRQFKINNDQLNLGRWPCWWLLVSLEGNFCIPEDLLHQKFLIARKKFLFQNNQKVRLRTEIKGRAVELDLDDRVTMKMIIKQSDTPHLDAVLPEASGKRKAEAMGG